MYRRMKDVLNWISNLLFFVILGKIATYGGKSANFGLAFVSK